MSLSVVHIGGSWRDIGRAYGEELRGPIANGLDAYEEIAPSLGGTMSELLARVGPFAEPARKHAPDRFEELVGMAEGAGIALERALLLNCIEELTDVDACTTVARGGFLLHAEMWFPQQTDVAAVFAAPSQGPPVVAVSCAGFLPGVGVSSAGFALGVQSTFSVDCRIGVPRAMVSRDALCATSPQQGIVAMCNPHRAGGYGYVIATSRESWVVETSAAESAVFQPVPIAAHTNHYVAPVCATVARRSSPESELRLAAAETTVREERLGTLEDARRLLSTTGFQSTSPASPTIFGMACDLESGLLSISDGDPREGHWQTYGIPEWDPDSLAEQH